MHQSGHNTPHEREINKHNLIVNSFDKITLFITYCDHHESINHENASYIYALMVMRCFAIPTCLYMAPRSAVIDADNDTQEEYK